MKDIKFILENLSQNINYLSENIEAKNTINDAFIDLYFDDNLDKYLSNATDKSLLELINNSPFVGNLFQRFILRLKNKLNHTKDEAIDKILLLK